MNEIEIKKRMIAELGNSPIPTLFLSKSRKSIFFVNDAAVHAYGTFTDAKKLSGFLPLGWRRTVASAVGDNGITVFGTKKGCPFSSVRILPLYNNGKPFCYEVQPIPKLPNEFIFHERMRNPLADRISEAAKLADKVCAEFPDEKSNCNRIKEQLNKIIQISLCLEQLNKEYADAVKAAPTTFTLKLFLAELSMKITHFDIPQEDRMICNDIHISGNYELLFLAFRELLLYIESVSGEIGQISMSLRREEKRVALTFQKYRLPSNPKRSLPLPSPLYQHPGKLFAKKLTEAAGGELTDLANGFNSSVTVYLNADI